MAEHAFVQSPGITKITGDMFHDVIRRISIELWLDGIGRLHPSSACICWSSDCYKITPGTLGKGGVYFVPESKILG